MQIRLRP